MKYILNTNSNLKLFISSIDSHGLMKRNNLVNYKAFLCLYHDQGENSVTQDVIRDTKA